MLSRILSVAFFTGSAHILSLYTISFVFNNLGDETAGYVGVIDSTVMLMATVISFGIQLTVNRNVATQTGWRSSYILGQSARISLSLLVVLYGLISLLFNWDFTKIVIFYAPLIALNGDYALYGNGKPIAAARLSFFRVAIPNLGLLITGRLFPTDAIYYYIMLVAVGICIAGFFSSRINKVPYLFKPTRSFVKIYYKSLKVGMFQVASAVLVTGLLAVSRPLYALATLGLVTAVLKYFEVFKGGLRIVIQTFFREFKDEETAIRIDKATILLGGLMLIPTVFYPEQTLSFIYNDRIDELGKLFAIFGIAMLVASFKTSGDITALLLKKDNLNLGAYVTGMVVAIIVSFALSFTDFENVGIPLGILSGEVTLLLILGFGLGGFRFFYDRLKFLVTLVPAFVAVYFISYLISDSLLILIISVSIYLSWSLLLHRKLIFENKFSSTRN